MGPLIPLFWTSGDVPSGQPYLKFADAHIRFTSCATPLPVYNTSISASHLPHIHVSTEVGCQDLNCWPPAQQSDVLPTWPRWSAWGCHTCVLKLLRLIWVIKYIKRGRMSVQLKCSCVSSISFIQYVQLHRIQRSLKGRINNILHSGCIVGVYWTQQSAQSILLTLLTCLWIWTGFCPVHSMAH